MLTTARAATARSFAVALLVALATSVACSSLPEPSLPPWLDHDVAAEFVVPDDGRLQLPTSGHTLLVHELTLDPPPLGEQFGDTIRWFAYGPGTRVQVRARFRTYGRGGQMPAAAAEILAGAARVRSLEAER